MVEPIYFLKPAWCGKTFCRPSAGTGLTARYQSHRLEAVVCHSRQKKSQAVASAGCDSPKSPARVVCRRGTDIGNGRAALVKPDAADQVRKSRIGADGIEVGMHFEELQNIRLLFIGLLEPGKGLVVVTESQISVHKSARGNVTCLSGVAAVPQGAEEHPFAARRGNTPGSAPRSQPGLPCETETAFSRTGIASPG